MQSSARTFFHRFSAAWLSDDVDGSFTPSLIVRVKPHAIGTFSV